jgi:hypothetical protein
MSKLEELKADVSTASLAYIKVNNQNVRYRLVTYGTVGNGSVKPRNILDDRSDTAWRVHEDARKALKGCLKEINDE